MNVLDELKRMETPGKLTRKLEVYLFLKCVFCQFIDREKKGLFTELNCWVI